MLTIPPDGQTPGKPTVLGEPNGAPPIQVIATGLFISIRKDDVRWVTGSAVEKGLASGVIVQIGAVAPEDYAEPRNPRPADETPPAEPPPSVEPPKPTDIEKTLADMSKAELVNVARAVDLEGRSAMDKSELYEHLRRHPKVADHLH